MYRQGDILFRLVEEPMGAKTQEKIIQEGSMTGHHHKLVNGIIFRPTREEIRYMYGGIIAYIEAHDGCQVVHDEHETIELPVGIYEVRRQREVNGYVED